MPRAPARLLAGGRGRANDPHHVPALRRARHAAFSHGHHIRRDTPAATLSADRLETLEYLRTMDRLTPPALARRLAGAMSHRGHEPRLPTREALETSSTPPRPPPPPLSPSPLPRRPPDELP